ncbi:MAG: septum formation initiator family protein [Nitrospirae bacterium]|nr:septum formation initiator family protein [Nitrospirota bacterium]
MRNVRRKQVEENRKKRQVVYLTFAILLFVYLTLNMIIGENGLMKFIELKSEINRMLAETATIEKQNQDVTNRIETLKNNPDGVEELAREHGLTKKGELIFKFKDQQ